MRAVIDRFEGEYAVLEINNEMVNVRHSDLPPKVREGDVLLWQRGSWVLDYEASRYRKKMADELMKQLWD